MRKTSLEEIATATIVVAMTSKKKKKNEKNSKKSHLCGAHLRISFWHLLVNFEKPQKIESWKNEKKLLEISPFYICVPNTKNHNQWGTVPEIWSGTIFFVILGHLLPFYPLSPNNPENHNFEKMKKAFGDVIILNLCNKRHNPMMYADSDMACNRHNFLSFFCFFTPPLTPKIKIWKM